MCGEIDMIPNFGPIRRNTLLRPHFEDTTRLVLDAELTASISCGSEIW